MSERYLDKFPQAVPSHILQSHSVDAQFLRLFSCYVTAIQLLNGNSTTLFQLSQRLVILFVYFVLQRRPKPKMTDESALSGSTEIGKPQRELLRKEDEEEWEEKRKKR